MAALTEARVKDALGRLTPAQALHIFSILENGPVPAMVGLNLDDWKIFLSDEIAATTEAMCQQIEAGEGPKLTIAVYDIAGTRINVFLDEDARSIIAAYLLLEQEPAVDKVYLHLLDPSQYYMVNLFGRFEEATEDTWAIYRKGGTDPKAVTMEKDIARALKRLRVKVMRD